MDTNIYKEMYIHDTDNIVLNMVKFFDLLKIIKVDSELKKIKKIDLTELCDARHSFIDCVNKCQDAIKRGYTVQIYSPNNELRKKITTTVELNAFLFKDIHKSLGVGYVHLQE